MADTEHVDALRQTDEAAPLSDTELDEIRRRNDYLRTVPFETHGPGIHGDGCPPCGMVRSIGDVTRLLAALHDARAQLRTETAITKALLADKEELAMRAHHAEVNRDHAREELAKVQRELGRRLGPVGDNG